MDQATLATPLVAAAPQKPASLRSWGLVEEHARAVQGLVVSPFAHLAATEALFLRADQAGGAWLRALREVAPVTDAAGRDPEASTAIAFTWPGLRALGLDPEALTPESLSRPFIEGMHQEDRRRRLGDVDGVTVVPGGPRWSAGADPVHALLLLYAVDNAALDARLALVEPVLARAAVRTVHRLRLSLGRDADGRIREHFGFADGFSQPVPHGEAIVPPGGASGAPDPWHGVPAGEILLGHQNAHGEDAPGPVVRVGRAATDRLFDLGRNGSYLVVRELRQDVAAFWRSMDEAAAAIGEDADWLAARVIGRERDGDLLTPNGPLLAKDGQPDNACGFLAGDPRGLGCPLGSHIRRANPRDGLAPDEASGPGLLQAANNHRILRRGRKFGPRLADLRQDDGAERGLLFMCLNTDIARQFEFIQQTWLLNRGFATLHGETDPLLGPRGRFTLPDHPIRRRVQVETFVQMAGGAYFFLPSLPALDFLANLPGEHGT